ncbi:MAG: orotidine-5'-phosphate decarboxylase [Saprospiraceae bacterium]|nr:orotidine-5'-phosphate decarboxylase [Saprospiraceae bacterium]
MKKDQDYLAGLIRQKKSFLCVGLDPDLSKMPDSYTTNAAPLFEFCKDVIESTKHTAIAYKINIAFFEAFGPDGWKQLEDLRAILPEESLVIADAKRADIGNTSEKYAQYFFERLNADALTLHPYMGIDSLDPFLAYPDKWSVVLALTSNPGAADFELQKMADDSYLFELVLRKFGNSTYSDRVMFVVGATHSTYLERVRKNVPDAFLLIPGVGEQGGNLQQTILTGRNQKEGLIINVGRKIMYPKGKDTKPQDIQFAAEEFHRQMKEFF